MNIDINMMRFPNYMHAQTESRAARAEYNAAAQWLEITHVRERNAELASQSFESVAKGKLLERLGELTEREREIGIAFARYATFGRTDLA